MTILDVILFILLSITTIIYIISLYKESKRINKIEKAKKEELKNLFKERWDKEEYDFKLKETKLQAKEKEIKSAISQLEISLKEKEKRYDEVNQDLNLYKKGKIEEIDKTAAEYERSKRLENAQAIEEHNNSMKKASAELQEQLKRSENILKEQIEKIKIELEAEQSKRDAINEEILRQRKVEEEQDFYRIQIDSDDKNDVEILRNIAPRLRHPEAINKVIWTGYYQKPLAELRKRLLSNGDISGIYKITRMKTKEIYIGQSTSIDKRWQEHVKTALGVGNLASSQFHRVMAKDGPENFFFEILEETKKDKLREREAYYIQWFRSDKFGLNSNSGDKNK